VVSGRKFEVSIGTDRFRSGFSIRCQPDEIEGADEIDRVMNIRWLMEGNYHLVEEDLEVVRSAIGEAILLKVIIESAGAQS
jgi:deoxyribose-phosphate aldolase